VICLGIETSCDETAAALVTGEGQVLGSVVASQIDLHEAFGGVVPEVAARRHLERLSPTVRRAIEEAGIGPEEIGLVAVTRGPGLAGALMVGLSFAKAYAFARGLPLVGVNHVVAHAYAAFLGAEVRYPELALVASGGHTVLLQLRGPQDALVLGRSRDDAAGEAFDKVARALGLGYPGGPLIEAIAREGDPLRCPLPVVRPIEGSLDFSFSGLKTAAQQRFLAGEGPADVAAAFQEAVLAQILSRTRVAIERLGARRLVFAGGVSANGFLRERLAQALAPLGVELVAPPMHFSTDNAAMIARLGLALYAAGERAPRELNAEPVIHPFKP
jgi:N6-L-threonylcarbamoyladenine synthase